MGDLAWAAVWVVLAVLAGVAAVRQQDGPLHQPLLPALALGDLFAAAAAIGGLPLGTQLAIAAVTTALGVVLLWRWRTLVADDRLPTGVGGHRMAGGEGVVTATVDGGPGGRVKVLGDEWPATAPEGVVLPAGASVRVVRVEGIHLHVEAAQPAGTPDAPTSSSPSNPTGGR